MALEWLKTILGETYTDEIDSKVSAEIGKGFVAKSDFNATKEDLKTAKASISDYETKIKTLKDSAADADNLNKKIADLQKEIDDRKAADEQAVKDKAMADRFTAAIGDKKFLNDFTQHGVLEEFKAALADKANTGKADADVFAAIVKDRDGIFANPNPIGGTPPAGGNYQPDKDSNNNMRAAMGLPPEK